jgi:alcohol dehydrogenase class IV
LFKGFAPNPHYESIVEGVNIFNKEKCDTIIAVGGGSAIDVAKCIKLYSNMNQNINFLIQEVVPNNIKLIAIPTTAGSGSESTRYAVIYYNGEKKSVSDYSCIPNAVLFDVSVLDNLPLYQKKSTMLDALCHSMESFWSVNSNEISKEYSRKAIKMIMEYRDGYLNNEIEGNSKMQQAANLAGKAINITQTTAGHAMSYKITSLYGVAHGHAVALCVSKILPYMINNLDKCVDLRGKDYLKKTFDELAYIFNVGSAVNLVYEFDNFFGNLNMEIPKAYNCDFSVLNSSINVERMQNNPIKIERDTIDMLYHQILS